MKQVTAVLLVVLILTSISVISFAEKPATPFDPKVLSSLTNFKEDKFDGTFSYYQAYVEEYNDADVIIGMNLQNFEENLDEIIASLYVKVLDNSGDIMETVESIDFLIDDVIYSYKSMMEMSTSSTVLLDEDVKPLIEALSAATEVSVRIGMDKGSVTIDLETQEFSTTIKEYCKNILKYNVLDYLKYDDDSSYTKLIKLFPLTIKE